MRRVILVAAALAAVLGAGGARANDMCITWSVTAPAIGTKGTGPHCAPTPFTHSITWNSCGGVPPAGESHCVRLVLQTPI